MKIQEFCIKKNWEFKQIITEWNVNFATTLQKRKKSCYLHSVEKIINDNFLSKIQQRGNIFKAHSINLILGIMKI